MDGCGGAYCVEGQPTKKLHLVTTGGIPNNNNHQRTPDAHMYIIDRADVYSKRTMALHVHLLNTNTRSLFIIFILHARLQIH